AMRAMHLQHVEAGLMRAARGGAPGSDHVLDLRDRHGTRDRGRRARRDGARRHQLPLLTMIDAGMTCERLAAFPGQGVARLAPGMAELQSDRRTLRMHEA